MLIAINGFGRIGKNFLRILVSDSQAKKKLQVAAINIGPADPSTVAYTFKYDSILPTYFGSVEYKNKQLIIDNYPPIKIIAQADPAQLPWKDLGIEWVVEASGHFTHKTDAIKHLQAGAQGVLITAPAHGEDVTIIPGVNDALFNKNQHKIVSLGSCTTNALVPMLDLMLKKFGIEQAAMTTTHAYTSTQALLDGNANARDPRRSRAAALNIVPTTTGAMDVISRILPQLENKITGCSLRVPVPTVSLIDLAIITPEQLSVQDIIQACHAAKAGYLHSILDSTQTLLVSSDYQQSSFSVTIDEPLTTVSGNLTKIFGWYDNEWGYSCRLKDFFLRCFKS